MPTFKTKDGKTVSFKAKGEGRTRARPRARTKRRKSQSRGNPKTTKRRTMARRHRKSHRGSGSSNITQTLLGAAVAGFVGSMVPYGNYGKVGAALVGHKQGGIIGNTAKALGVIGVANLVSGAGITTQTIASGAKW